ncbi:hypothetical protein [Cyanobium sp. NIES-981]|uniref:hypothetical protein n=1 Tax=Cyanobium sp. NIES-981 TaxID=1851505 RepID=UPI0012F85848|nr:hypothetical protein [Cyanobium sp. NIES-981]
MSGSRQAILHIGAPKAGSSSIQGFLKANYIHWKSFGVLAPGMTGAKVGLNHRSLYFAFHKGSISRVDRMRFRSELDYAEHRQLQRKLVSAELKSHAFCETLIFSDEYLTRLDRESVHELRCFLEDHGVEKFLILAYVREPGSLFLSSAQQSIKAHHELPTPIGWKHEFSEVLSVWKSIFPEAVLFRPYEREALKNNSVVDDFLDATASINPFLNLEDKSLAMGHSPQNLSLTAEGMALLLDYRRAFHRDRGNAFTPDTRQLILCLQECAASQESQRARLRPAWRQYIEACHAAELLKLADHYGLRYGGIDYEKLVTYADGREPSPPAAVETSLQGGMGDVAQVVDSISPSSYAKLSLLVLHKMAHKAAENSKLKRALKEQSSQP